MSNPFILPYEGVKPSFGAPVVAGSGSAVLGRVTMGKGGRLGRLAVVRADGHYVQIGDDFDLGACSTVHIAHGVFPCIIGDRVSVGEHACVHACTVGNDVVIGDNVVILDGAVVEDGVIFEASATVFPGKKIEAGQVYAGSPARAMRAVAPGEIESMRTKMRKAGEPSAPLGVRSLPAPQSRVDPTCFIAGTATIRGRLNAAPRTSVWFSNDFDAGAASISIGANSNVQDNTIIRCGTEQGVTIGENSTVGHNVTLHDCTIGDHSLIGIGSVVAQGTVVGDHVLLAAGSRTEPGQVLESGWLYGRTPARPMTRLDRAKQEMIGFIIGTYCEYGRHFGAMQRELAEETAGR